MSRPTRQYNYYSVTIQVYDKTITSVYTSSEPISADIIQYIYSSCARVRVRLSVVTQHHFISMSDDIRILNYEKARGR
jgi:hypothetical protein